MSKLPQRVWLPLSDAADFICKKCECSIEDARQALFEALRNGQIDARGTRPNPVYQRASAEGRRGPDWQRTFPPQVGRRLNPEFFSQHDPDWQTNTVGEVSDVAVNRASLLRWLGEDDAAVPGLPLVPAETESGRQPQDATADPYRTGLPGRPTISHLILAEFRRRAEAGEVEPTLAKEASALHEWAKQEHPTASTPTPDTIQNHIRAEHRRYKANEPTK